jgi:hypothetical protein
MTDPITALFSSVSAIAKTARDLADTADTAKRNAQLIEFQQAVIGLQSSVAAVQAQNASLASRVRELEEDLARTQAWEVEKRRYMLVSPWAGATLYALKRDAVDPEVPHWLCPNCFNKSHKVHLAQVDSNDGWIIVVCPACELTMATPFRNGVAAKYAEDYAAP